MNQFAWEFRYLTQIASILFLCSWQVFPETSAASQSEIRILATGRAEIKNNDQSLAREEAKQAAAMAALEETIGYYITSRSETGDYESLYHKVISQSAGMVTIRKIIKEERQGDIFIVQLEAGVSPRPVFDVLRLNGLLRSWRVMVVIPEVHIRSVAPDPAGETEFIRQFSRAGFKVIDPGMYAQIRRADSQVFKSERKLQHFARKAGADILIYGEAFSERAGDATGGLASGLVGCNARIEARAVALETGEVFHANGLNSQVPVLHTSELVAGKKAIQNLAEQLASNFISQMLSSLSGVTRNHTVMVKGISSLQKAMQIEKALGKVKGVKKILREHYSNDLLQLDISLKAGEADKFADRISSLSIKGLPLRVVTSTRLRTSLLAFPE